jgi:hypothetical protein
MDRSESHSSPASTVSNTVEGSRLGDVQAATNTEADEVSNPTTPISYSSLSGKRYLDIKSPKRSCSRPSSVSSSIQKSTSTRIPHNQVERKYRNGLNSGMEELRMSVPSIAQWKPCPTSTNLRLSKRKVLSSTIIYIKELERERDELAKKIEIMRQ